MNNDEIRKLIETLTLSRGIVGSDITTINKYDQEIIGIVYPVYKKNFEKWIKISKDPNIKDIQSFCLIARPGSEIDPLINYLNSLLVETERKPSEKPEIKEETASIPPELEALVPQYQENLAQKNVNDGKVTSVAESVKRAREAMIIRQRLATIRHNRAVASGKTEAEFNQAEDENYEKILKATVRPKKIVPEDKHVFQPITSVAQQVVDSYIDTLPGLSANQRKHLHSLSPQIIQTVEYLALTGSIDIANHNDLTVAVSLAVYEADNSYSTPVSQIYTQLEENEKQHQKLNEEIAAKQLVLSTLKNQSLTATDEAKKLLDLQITPYETKIESLIRERDSINLDIKQLTKSVEFFVSTATPRTISGAHNLDLDTDIETAAATLNTAHERLSANKDIKPNIPPPEDLLKEATDLEDSIRSEMPQIGLNLHPTTKGVQAAALLSSPAALSPDLSSQALLLYSQGLGTKELDRIIAHAKDHKNDPNSQLARLLRANPYLFGTLRQQISNIETAHIERVNDFVKDPNNKNTTLAQLAKNNPAAYQEYLELSKTNTPKQIAKIAKTNPATELGKFFSKNTKIFNQITSEFSKVIKTSLGKEIKPSTNPVTRTINNVNNRILSVFTKIPFFSHHQGIIKTILDPLGSFRQYLGRRFFKFFTKNVIQKITYQPLRVAAKMLVRKGLKTTLSFFSKQAAAKLAAWAAIKLGISVALNTLNIAFPFLGAILNVAFLALSWIGEKTFGAVKNTINSISQAFTGKEFSIKETIKEGTVALGAIAGAGVSGIGSFISALGMASAAAAGSALGIILIASFAGYFFYITSILVAPMISTIAQLEATPKTGYHGPIQPGCPSLWPVGPGFILTQGPGGQHSHNNPGYDQSVDIATPMGTPIISTTYGTVSYADISPSYVNTDIVIIDSILDDGTPFQVVYAHLSSIDVHIGESVEIGSSIGTTGTAGTGAHLHYEYKGIQYNQCPAGGIHLAENCPDGTFPGETECFATAQIFTN